MLSIKEYICSYEECIEMIKAGINRYDRNELYDLISNQGTFGRLGNGIIF